MCRYHEEQANSFISVGKWFGGTHPYKSPDNGNDQQKQYNPSEYIVKVKESVIHGGGILVRAKLSGQIISAT
jgi:hypothetical protein